MNYPPTVDQKCYLLMGGDQTELCVIGAYTSLRLARTALVKAGHYMRTARMLADKFGHYDIPASSWRWLQIDEIFIRDYPIIDRGLSYHA